MGLGCFLCQAKGGQLPEWVRGSQTLETMLRATQAVSRSLLGNSSLDCPARCTDSNCHRRLRVTTGCWRLAAGTSQRPTDPFRSLAGTQRKRSSNPRTCNGRCQSKQTLDRCRQHIGNSIYFISTVRRVDGTSTRYRFTVGVQYLARLTSASHSIHGRQSISTVGQPWRSREL